MSDLSPHMKRAAAAMANPEGLERYPGDYWRPIPVGRSYTTATVEALVTRGVAAYTEFVEGRRGRFPVRVELVVDGQKPPMREVQVKRWTPAIGYFQANPQEATPA